MVAVAVAVVVVIVVLVVLVVVLLEADRNAACVEIANREKEGTGDS